MSRDGLRRACTAAAVVVPMGIAAGALAVDGRDARVFLLLYIAPFFVAFFAWARIRVDEIGNTSAGARAVDALATVLAGVRMAGPFVPASGHMLFFTYSALATRSVPYRLLVLALVAETTWYKLFVWDDFASWALGIAAGLTLAAVRLLIHRSTRSVPVP
ncbi:MAG TPA: hypothetical protein VE871_14905 [Longimicrobium sp.]|nr:hypothetical protein [Longimicrobium sp.]